MSTDDGTATEASESGSVDPPEDVEQRSPSRWHRDHPIFNALSGFFTGLVTIIVVPGAFAAILGTMFDYDRAEELFPLVLVIFAIPLAMLAAPRSRAFGKYMLLGMALTAVVVVVVAALVLWILYLRDS
jgi:4-amino-4-deoxy-L-arabinose transferase-like glycosyltransferase